jgi:hypothetical protein
MASERMRALLDDLGKVGGERLEQLRAAGAVTSPADNPLGLRFANGARVVDLATGTKANVIRGMRDSETGGARYSIRLDDARLVFRVDSELEPDPAPALPFGK